MKRNDLSRVSFSLSCRWCLVLTSCLLSSIAPLSTVPPYHRASVGLVLLRRIQRHLRLRKALLSPARTLRSLQQQKQQQQQQQRQNCGDGPPRIICPEMWCFSTSRPCTPLARTITFHQDAYHHKTTRLSLLALAPRRCPTTLQRMIPQPAPQPMLPLRCLTKVLQPQEQPRTLSVCPSTLAGAFARSIGRIGATHRRRCSLRQQLRWDAAMKVEN